MKLYFAPLSCSMATRIALYEAGIDAEFEEVVLGTKRTKAGNDYLFINPKGQVPALVTDEGAVVTEGPAVLQYVADRAPQAKLAPPAETFERTQLHQWLNYISTEVHKAVFYLLFNPSVPADAKAFARDSLPAKYDFLSRALENREFLVGDAFTVADAYLVTTMGWAAAVGIDLTPWPTLGSYYARVIARPSVARAFAEEAALRETA